jgi:hypothetical protein
MPDRDGVPGVEIGLEAVLAGVAGARDDDVLAPSDGADVEVVVADGFELNVCERLENFLRVRALEGEERDGVGDVLELAVELGELLRNVSQVLVLVRRVHDHHHVIGKAVDEAVVLERAAVVEDPGVVDLVDFERGHIVRRHVVHEIDRLRSGDQELAHVADVEESAVLADGVVLGGDAGGILDGHLEAGEGDHLGAECDVDVVKGGLLEHGF